MNFVDMILLVFFCVMSVIAIAFTVYDKKAATLSPHHRVPEHTLMRIALFFGSFAMYITMQLIRHKTKHAKFMYGIPFYMLLHAIVIAAYIFLIRPLFS